MIFFYFTLAIQQNIYFSHFPWQQFNVQLRKYKARGLIASGYTIQTSWWWRFWASRTLYSFSNSLFRNILQTESMSWSRGVVVLFTIKKQNKKKTKKQASTRMLGSVCTIFWPGNWSDVASNVSLFIFFIYFFVFF